MLIEEIVTQSITILITAYLARILSPKDFGVIALAMVVFRFYEVLFEGGLSSSLIKERDISNKDTSSIFWFNVTVGILLSISTFMFSSQLQYFLGIDAPYVMCTMALLPLLRSLRIVPFSILYRGMRYKRIFFINFFALLFSGIVAIITSNISNGVMSLVLYRLSREFFVVVLLIQNIQKNVMVYFNKGILTYHFRFSKFLTASGVLNVIFDNIHNFFLRNYYGLDSLGLYDRANNINRMPLLSGGNVLNKVTFPLFSSLGQKKNDLASMLNAIVSVVFPLAVMIFFGLMLGSNRIISILLGEKWLDSSEYLQILSPIILPYLGSVMLLSLLKSQGHSGTFFKLELIKKFMFFVMCLPFLMVSIRTFAVSTVIVTYMGAYITYYWALKKLDIDLKYFGIMLMASTMCVFVIFFLYKLKHFVGLTLILLGLLVITIRRCYILYEVLSEK